MSGMKPLSADEAAVLDSNAGGFGDLPKGGATAEVQATTVTEPSADEALAGVSAEDNQAPDVPPYPGLDYIRSMHGELLKRQRELESKDSPGFQEEVEAFIYRTQATGKLLEADRDRNTAQRLIDYWVTVLYRITRTERPEPVLAEFDKKFLAQELSDEQYPYLDLALARDQRGGLFVGTKRLVEECIAKLEENRLAAIVGPSGSGRSTLLYSGLVPALKGGHAVGSQNWRLYPPMTPGTDPLTRLASLFCPPDVAAEEWARQQADCFRHDHGHLARLVAQGGDEPAVLVFDQFEEAFTLCDEPERLALVDNLLRLVQGAGAIHMAVLVMKSDFLRRVDQLPQLQKLFREGLIYLSFTTDELRQAIQEPANLMGLKYDEGVVDRLILDIQGDPAALTLLQFTLRKLWENRDLNRITWDAYNRVGGGRLALERSAEDAYDKLSEAGQRIAHRVLLRVVRPGLGQESDVLGVPREQLRTGSEPAEQIDEVVDRFVQAGLLRWTGGPAGADQEVTFVHEALVSHWPRLGEWLSEEREDKRRRLRLTAAAKTWDEQKREPGLLWSGSALDEAEGYSDLDELETEFIGASRAEVIAAEEEKIAAIRHESERNKALAEQASALAEQAKILAAEQQRRADLETERANLEERRADLERRTARVLRYLLGLLALALTAAAVLGIWAGLLWQKEQRGAIELTVAHGGHLLESGDPSGALLWFQHAVAKENDDSLKEVHRRRVAVGLRQQAVLGQIWRQTPAQDPKDPQKFVTGPLAFNEAGLILAFSREMGGNLGVVQLLNPNTNEHKDLFKGESGRVDAAAFSPDGHWAAAAINTPDDKSTVNIWDVSKWETVDAAGTTERIDRIPGRVNAIAFSRGRKYLAAAVGAPGANSGETRVWDFDKKQALPPIKHLGPASFVAFSPTDDSVLVATGKNADGTGWAQVVRLEDAGPRPFPLPLHQGPVIRAAFSPDGRRIATASGDQGMSYGEVQLLWDWEKEEVGRKRLKHSDGVMWVEFSPCGRMVVTASHDGSVLLWMADDARYVASFRHGSSVYCASFSPDGRYLVTGCRDQTARVWDIATRELALPPLQHHGTVSHARFSPDGRRLGTASRDVVRIWEFGSANPPPRTLACTGDVQQVSCSADGHRAVTASVRRGNEAGSGLVWDLDDESRKPVTIPRDVRLACLNENGSLAVTIDRRGKLELWEVDSENATAQPSKVVFGDTILKRATSLALSPNGNFIAVGEEIEGSLGRLRVYNGQTGKELAVSGDPHKERILSLSFDRTERRIVTGSADDTARIWDVAAGEKVENSGKGARHTADVVHAALNADGRRLLTSSRDQTAAVWDVRSNEKLATLRHGSYVNHSRFSRDGRYVLTAAHDGKARLWHLDDSHRSELRPQIVAVLDHGANLQQANLRQRTNQGEQEDQVVTVGYCILKPVAAPVAGAARDDTGHVAIPSFERRLVRTRVWGVASAETEAEPSEDWVKLLAARSFVPARQGFETFSDSTLLGEIWKETGAAYRSAFVSQPFLAQYEAEADECLANEQWSAAIWHLDKLIDGERAKRRLAFSAGAGLFAKRVQAHGELGNFEQAAKDSQFALDLDRDRFDARYGLALACLANKDLAGYQTACREMLALCNPAASYDDAERTNTAVWACVVAPEGIAGLVDPKKLIRVAEDLADKGIEQKTEQGDKNPTAPYRYLNTLAAVYYRAKDHEKAIETLKKAELAYDTWYWKEREGRSGEGVPEKGTAWDWLFLAVAYRDQAAPGDAEKAEAYRKKVVDLMKHGTPEQVADAVGGTFLPWTSRLALERLCEEFMQKKAPAAKPVSLGSRKDSK